MDMKNNTALLSGFLAQDTVNLGEMFYADSKFSNITQIGDIISYLRCINDQKIIIGV